MNETVRQGVKDTMKAQGLTHQELADLTGIERPNITRLLTGAVGKVPDNWQRVLDALGLELVAVPKKDGNP
ncbi:helix-turn-helix domain-containing protein [Deinococcus frigens]|uniref:helix-turn-helix domain-containing protein n=1 Tax=Deinococcus frigens TaxID=249403 RepID=UPI000A673B03|nr:helix-turn-helix transcriptional regulator [Deinococcus frigens]